MNPLELKQKTQWVLDVCSHELRSLSSSEKSILEAAIEQMLTETVDLVRYRVGKGITSPKKELPEKPPEPTLFQMRR